MRRRTGVLASLAFSTFTIAAPAIAVAGSGACCTPTDCLPATSDPQCAALGGVFLPGANCAEGPCGPGACCYEQSCNIADAFSCITAGREYAGAGTTCFDDPCQAGVGACCFGDGSCQDLSPLACASAGGTWLGAGTSCGQGHCTLGACCTINDCVDLPEYQCTAPDAAFTPGGACAVNPCNECAPGYLFGQERDGPEDFTAGTSEATPGFIRFEDYSGVDGSIEALAWWGLDLDSVAPNVFVECTEPDPTFLISFHEDAGGVPGAVVCSYTLTAARIPLGILYLGTELNKYTVSLPEPCVLIEGWVSIVGLGDPECWFLWMSAEGPGSSYCQGCASPQESFGLSLCIEGTEGGVFGSCCDDATGACADNVEITSCAAPGLRFSPDQACGELDPPCGVIVGGCCLAGAACSVLTEEDCAASGGSWQGADTTCASCPCQAACPPDGTAEGEPVCTTGYIDQFNGGCNALSPAFSSIAPGETVCGESGVFLVPGDIDGDFDWYQVDIAGSTRLTWSATAEFAARIWIIDGNDGCAGAFILTTVGGVECQEISVTAPVGPGIYWLVIGPTTFSDTSDCGAGYTATLQGRCAADLDGDGVVGILDFLALLAGWGSPSGDVDGDGTTGILDFLALLGAWGPC